MSFPITMNCPPDGWQDYEEAFFPYTVINIYKTVKDPKDMFILMAIKEMGYPQEIVGNILGISQVAVSNRLKKITVKLYGKKKDNLL